MSDVRRLVDDHCELASGIVYITHTCTSKPFKDLKSDRDLVFAAVRENGLALSHAAKAIVFVWL